MKKLSTYINEAKSKFTCYMLIGLPGSGKSTWCKTNHPDLPVVSRDIIRSTGEGYEFKEFCLGFTKNVDEKAVLDFRKENQVTEKERELMKKLAKEKRDFIMDDTNLKTKYRKQSIQFLRTIGAKIVGVYFDTPLETCIKRRKGQIDAETMKQIASKINIQDKTEFDEFIKIKD